MTDVICTAIRMQMATVRWSIAGGWWRVTRSHRAGRKNCPCVRKNTNVPFAVTEAELLAELGWNIWDNERDVNDGLFSESVMRKLLAKYKSEEWVSFYNSYVQEHLMKELDIQPCVHILDCTKVLVNLDNDNYENSSVVKIDGETMRGYKLGVLRGVLDDSGIAEEIVF